MRVADKLTQIAWNEQKVYDSGYSKAEYDFWNSFTYGGKRRNYSYAFFNSGFEYIRPTFKLVGTRDTSAANMFAESKKLKKVESAYVDFSQKALGFSNAYSYYFTFSLCEKLEEIEDIGFKADEWGYQGTFERCFKLHTIAVIRTAQHTKFANTFFECNALENLTIEGIIGQNGFNVQYSTKLTHDSLMSIINALADYSADTSGTTWTVTLGSGNIAKLTEEEQLIAYMKGWNLA